MSQDTPNRVSCIALAMRRGFLTGIALVLALALHPLNNSAAGQTATIFACIPNDEGRVRIVSEAGQCKDNETELSWSIQDSDTLADLVCDPDDILKFDGSAWVCAQSSSGERGGLVLKACADGSCGGPPIDFGTVMFVGNQGQVVSTIVEVAGARLIVGVSQSTTFDPIESLEIIYAEPDCLVGSEIIAVSTGGDTPLVDVDPDVVLNFGLDGVWRVIRLLEDPGLFEVVSNKQEGGACSTSHAGLHVTGFLGVPPIEVLEPDFQSLFPPPYLLQVR